MKRSLISFFSLLAVATAQSLDDFELIYPGDGINFEACYKDLDAADNIVRDGGVRQDEFLGFIQKYAERKCLTNNAMSLRQFAAFNALSCVCASLEGQDASCCLGDNGQVDTGGALTPLTRTEPQIQFLIYTCITMDNTLPETACIPPVDPLGIAPPADLGGVIGASNVPDYTKQVDEDDDDDNVWDWLKWVLIALGILLLLLCCCCCTIRRKRLLAIAEEEEEQRLAAAAAAKNMDVEQAPELTEQYPSDNGDADADNGEHDVVYTEGEEEFRVEVAEESETAPDEEMAVASSAAAAGMNNDDDDDDEDGNRRRGAHNLPADDDEEKRRIAGYGQLPPDEDPDNPGMKLRPIPPKEKEEDPDWDHPGRDINFPKPEPDEYSAQEFDPYDPGGGYVDPNRQVKEPNEYVKPHWERLKKETPEEVDMRKRRIQSGLGEAEVWNILEDHDDHEENNMNTSGDVFDWVVESALGVLDKSDDVVHLKDEDQES